MNLKCLKVWTVTFRHDAPVRQWVDQDTVRVVGHDRVESKANILCENGDMAVSYIKKEFENSDVEIIMLKKEIKLHGILTTQWLESVDCEKVK